MFRLESKRLKREFKISDGKFYASQIVNTYSGMNFVPDGNGCEFVIHFEDGSEYSSKGLDVIDSHFENDKLMVKFEENMGISVTLEYWIHNDQNTFCKHIILDQNNDKTIDFIELEKIGIINSKTHLDIDVMPDGEISGVHASLGQPFFIDSLFFGCEFPATENRIIHGAGTVRYYIGKPVGKNFVCPTTVMGASKNNTVIEVRKAFFEYIESISVGANLRFQFNSWYDHMRDIDEEKIFYTFSEVHKKLNEHGAPALDAYVVDDGWVNFKKPKFWEYNSKFPNGMEKVTALCNDLNSNFGMWLGPRGGYVGEWKLAKKFQKAGNGYWNKEGNEICVASTTYVEKLQNFLIEQTKAYDIRYWKLDGFATKPCPNPKHDHMVGGTNDMYYVTDLWTKWVELYKNLRAVNPEMWINMTCYVNVSPWWLQWVNSLWLQNSNDIGFSDNQENQAQVESEITYRDGRYYDCICARANQIPLKHIYNHEPIYGTEAKVNYTDEEFEKYIYWCMVRGQAINELHLTPSMMNDTKWAALAKAMNCQKANYHILKNANFIGGNPVENNIYGYVSWTEDGEGILAFRNPTNESTDITITMNKLMGTPESLDGAKRFNIYCNSIPEDDQTYSYNDKMDITLKPYEAIIFKIGKER